MDDNDGVRLLLETLLDDIGRIESCASGEEALTLLDDGGSFDVVVLDLNLDGISGADVLEEMAARGVNTPAVVISGLDGSDPLLARASRTGAAVVRKPFDNGRLLEAVRGAAMAAPQPGM